MTINEFKQIVAGSEMLAVWWTAADGDGGHIWMIEYCEYFLARNFVYLYPHYLQKPENYLLCADILDAGWVDSEIFVVVDGDKYPIKQVNLNKNWVEIVA